MRFGNILAVLDGREGSRSVAETSLALIRENSCQGEWFFVRQQEVHTAMAGAVGAGIVWDPVVLSPDDRGEQRLEAVRALYRDLAVAQDLATSAEGSSSEEAASPVGVPGVTLRVVDGFEPDAVEIHGRLFDLLVMSKPSREGKGGSSASLHAAIFGCGRPVLALPHTWQGGRPARIAIAWDGSKEAARTVTMALPVLCRADQVLVITGLVGDDVPPPSQLVRYLANHGIEAKTWAFVPQDAPLGQDILEQCEKAKADLLVMGAYSHSRLRELVLGGVTRQCLANASIPLLVAH